MMSRPQRRKICQRERIAGFHQVQKKEMGIQMQQISHLRMPLRRRIFMDIQRISALKMLMMMCQYRMNMNQFLTRQKLFLRLLLLMSQLKEEKRKGEIGGKQTVKALVQKLRYHNFRQMMMLKFLIVIIIKSIQTKNPQNKIRKKLLKIWKDNKKQKRK